MRKAAFVFAVLLLAAGAGFATPQREAAGPQTVRFWYHFDKAGLSLTPFVDEFQKENPTIKVVPEFIEWNAFYQKLVTAISGGTPPDVSMLKLWWQPQLVEMGALTQLDDYIKSWPGRSDIFENVWSLTKHSDGKQYLMPLQMVILYMYYRVDMMRDLGLKVAGTREEFLEVAKKLTRDTNGDGAPDVYGFGIRGGRGGHDWWGTFVLSSGARFFDAAGNSGLTTAEAIAANQWFIDMFRVHKVSPPTTPTDGFAEIIANMKSGRTATTIHHIGSSVDLEKVLGDKLSAFPVPRGTKGAWTSFGEGETGVLAASKVKSAAFKWSAFLATAKNNAAWVKLSGQVSINISNGQTKEALANRFLKATTDSAPFAGVMPAHPKVAEFVESVWPAQMQRAFNGQITSAQMMQAFADHFAKK